MLFAMLGSTTAASTLAANPAPKLKASDVIERWTSAFPKQKDFHLVGASPFKSPDVAAYAFKLEGASFGEMWNHCAKRCGVAKEYEEKSFLISGDTGPLGSYVVADRHDGRGGHRHSTFLLKTDTYVVTLSFPENPEDNSLTGTISAVVR